MILRIVSSGFVSSTLAKIQSIPPRVPQLSSHLLTLLLQEAQASIRSLFSLFAVIQITQSELHRIQATLASLSQSDCPQCGHLHALLHCLLFAVILDPPLFNNSVSPASDLPLSTFLSSTTESTESTLAFALALAILGNGDNSACVATVASGLSRHELHHIQDTITYLSYVGLPPPTRSYCLSLCYRVLILFITTYVLRSCPLTSLKSLRDHYTSAAMAVSMDVLPDGVETLIDTLCQLLPLLENPLQNSPIHSLLLFFLDRLSVQPFYFDCTLQLLTSIALLSPQAAADVHSLLLSYNSPMISWTLLLTSLQQTLRQLLQSHSPLCPDDVTGLTAILKLLAAVLQDPFSRQSLFEDTRFDFLSLCLQLLSQSLPVELIGALCDVLARCAEDKARARAIWSHLESNCISFGNGVMFGASGNNLSIRNFRQLYQSKEKPSHHYPFTIPFIHLLTTLLSTLPADSLFQSDAFLPLLDFVAQDILLDTDSCPSSSDNDRWLLLSHAFEFLALAILPFINQSSLLWGKTCMHALLLELTAPSPLLDSILSVQQMSLPPYPTSPSSQGIRAVVQAITLSSRLLSELLQLPPLSSSQEPVSLAQHLLAKPQTTIRLCLRVTQASQPSLQSVTMETLRLIASQVSPAAFVSFFSSFPEELALIRTACLQILHRAIIQKEENSDVHTCAHCLLRLLSQQANVSSSLTSLLLDLPATLHSRGVFRSTLLDELCVLIASPSVLLDHIHLAVHAFHLFDQLCTASVTNGNMLIQSLVGSHVIQSVVSLIPYFVELLDTHAITEEESMMQIMHSIICLATTCIFSLHSSQQIPPLKQILTSFLIPDLSTSTTLPQKSSNFEAPLVLLLSSLRRFALLDTDKISPNSGVPEIKTIHESVKSLLCLVQVTLIDAGDAWRDIPDVSSTVREVVLSLFQLVGQLLPPSLLRPAVSDTCTALMKLLPTFVGLEPGTIHNMLSCVLTCILNDPTQQSSEARSHQYLMLLCLLLELKKVGSLISILTPVQTAVPALLEGLTCDLAGNDVMLHATATRLLRLFATEDTNGAVTHLLLSETNLVSGLLQGIVQMDLVLIESPETTRQQFEIATQNLSLLSVMVTTTEGAMMALDLSLFGWINHCPLIHAIRENGASVLNLLQREDAKHVLRVILKWFLQIMLSVEITVRAIRSVQVELSSFVLAIAPLTPFLFRNRESEELLSLEVLGLFLGALVVLSSQPERFVEMMNGYEDVLKTEVVSLLNYVSKQEEVCNDIQKAVKRGKSLKKQSNRTGLYRILVENGMLFMSKMGWKIGDEYLRAFGVKS